MKFTDQQLSNDVLMTAAEVGREAYVDCGSCTACCKRELVVLMPDLGDDVASYETDTMGDKHVLKHKDNHDCIYLSDSGCTIYNRRPVMCKAFSCVGFYKRFMQYSRNERRLLIKTGRLDDDVLKAGRDRA